ncbi:hypothetical protein QBC38DRAFT_256316 [Podospora fimiseda]|uniref:Secreted protein n=1 Tax=Podospora fimiseda TaxID=252190 RepID=A0AAN7BLL1_9PEZI|nr:hypothetical protein QBC38DRAFT_256316 [Podospora fimiseda]
MHVSLSLRIFLCLASSPILITRAVIHCPMWAQRLSQLYPFSPLSLFPFDSGGKSTPQPRKLPALISHLLHNFHV